MSASASRQVGTLPTLHEMLNDKQRNSKATFSFSTKQRQGKSCTTIKRKLGGWKYTHKIHGVILIPTHNLVRRDDHGMNHDRLVLSTAHRRHGKRPRRNAMDLGCVMGHSNPFHLRKPLFAAQGCHDIAKIFEFMRIRVS